MLLSKSIDFNEILPVVPEMSFWAMKKHLWPRFPLGTARALPGHTSDLLQFGTCAQSACVCTVVFLQLTISSFEDRPWGGLCDPS